MQQRSFGDVNGFRRQEKVTRRERFLEEMDRAVPWDRFFAVIKPAYPVAGNGRRPYPLAAMLRIHLMQQWFGYSDSAMEDALHETPLLRRFAGLDAGTDCMPDETTILNFRHLLEKHQLAESLFGEVAALLTERGFILRQGTIVDATLVAAPPSTKNRDRKRDPDMTSSKKGNDWYPRLRGDKFRHEGAYRRGYGAWSCAHGPGHDRKSVRLRHGRYAAARR